MDPFESKRMAMYKTGDHTFLRAATDQPLAILRRASDQAAQAVAEYRRAVKAAAAYEQAHPGIPIDSLPEDRRAQVDIALPNPAGPNVERARLKLAQLETEVAAAEAGVRRASTEVRTAMGVGNRYLGDQDTHPMLQRLREVEAEMHTGSPQLKLALQVSRKALEDPAGGVDLHALPGWGQDQMINIGESAYVPEVETPWWDGLGVRS